MTKYKRCFVLTAVAAVLIFLFLWFGIRVPIWLSVKQVSDKIYAGEKLTVDDFSVSTKTLFGISHKLSDYTIVSSDGNVNVYIAYGNLQEEIHPDIIKATKLTASYDGTVYVGQAADEDCVSMTAEYEDGTTGVVDDVWLSHVAVNNVKDVYGLHVYSSVGDTYVDVPVIVPDSMSASYLGTAVVGQKMNWNRVSVTLHYPDDTTYRTHEFVVNDSKDINGETVKYESVKHDFSLLSYPKYLANDVTLFAITPYGVTEFQIHPKKMDFIVGHYDGVVYEGDILDDTKVSVTMSLDGESETNVTEYRFTNPGPIIMDTTIRIPTRYGVAPLKITPVKVKSVKADVGDNLIQGVSANVKSLTCVYEDDTTRTLDLDEVEFLNLPDKWGASQTVWFRYHNTEHSFKVKTIPKNIADLRGDMSVQMQTYQASDDVIETLTLICQRIGDKDLSVNADEVALMANRYELYGNGADGDGQSLLDYVYNSGYWGTKDTITAAIESSTPNEDVENVIRDALLNGYRSLPQYVDERVLLRDVDHVSTSSYEKDKTVVFLRNNDTIRCHAVYFDDVNVLYGYTEKAYKNVTDNEPVIPSEEGTDSGADEGGIVIE